MKNNFFLPALMVLFVILSSCNDSTTGEVTKAEKKSLIGQWIPVEVEGSELTEQDKQEILNGGTLEFVSGGLFVLSSTREGRHRAGKFQYDEVTNALHMESGDEKKLYGLEWLTTDKIVLIVPEENMKITFKKTVDTREREDNIDEKNK